MMAAIGANLAGNLIAAPILNGGLAAGQSPVPVLPPEPVQYGYASSNVGGVLIGANGKTTYVPTNKIQPIKGEAVYASTSSGAGLPSLSLITSNPLTPAVKAADPSATVEQKAESEQPEAYDEHAMNQAMLIGAVAGAVVAKLHGFHVLLGAGAGALVGHFYAGGAA